MRAYGNGQSLFSWQDSPLPAREPGYHRETGIGLILVSMSQPLLLIGADLLPASVEAYFFMDWLSKFCVLTDRMR